MKFKQQISLVEIRFTFSNGLATNSHGVASIHVKLVLTAYPVPDCTGSYHRRFYWNIFILIAHLTTKFCPFARTRWFVNKFTVSCYWTIF
jgi:hypothetical protein